MISEILHCNFEQQNWLLALQAILWEPQQEKDTGYSDKWQIFLGGGK
jgi:hypothetical protein